MQKNGIICFFYIDNIIFIFKKNQLDKIEKTIALLPKVLTIEKKRRVKIVFGALYNLQLLKKSLITISKSIHYKNL